MKNNAFLKVIKSLCLSFTMLFIALSIFIYSLKSATASEIPDSFSESIMEAKLKPNTTVVSGKYMMSYQIVFNNNDNKNNHYLLVWDTETGKSKIYDKDASGFSAMTAQLPENPLP